MKKSGASQGQSASELISKRIAELGDWRGKTLSRMRKLIKKAAPDVVEEWKWAKATTPGTPVWSHDGIICTGESYKNAVKLTFAKGAALKDLARLFNSSLDGNVRRAIDIHEGEEVDEAAFRRSFARRSPSTVWEVETFEEREALRSAGLTRMVRSAVSAHFTTSRAPASPRPDRAPTRTRARARIPLPARSDTQSRTRWHDRRSSRPSTPAHLRQDVQRTEHRFPHRHW